jgi:hypothetical protein
MRGSLWVDRVVLDGPVESVVGDDLLDVTAEWRAPPVLRLARADAAGAAVHAAFVDEHGDDLGAPALGEVTAGVPGDLRPGDRVLLAHDLPEGARLIASTAARDVEAEVAGPPANPLGAAGDARHVVLCVPDLLEAGRRLARHRSAHGLPSVAIPVTDVYDAFGHGEASPAAIRAFVVALQQRRDTPLEYVVLAGDATHDRTDYVPRATIPAPMARTMYNGATAADRLYARPPDGGAVGGPSIGRLPFQDADACAAYVDRVIRYETEPPADASRRLMRFVTSEARFGPLIDGLIERLFRSVVAAEIPPAYDIEVTFASATSPYLWPPPLFGEKVVSGLNAGCLFYTYVGHGFEQGFDSLRVGSQRFPILHLGDAARVAAEGTPPVVFVVACSTASFDMPEAEGIGEALLARPRGPVAYWGATRVCHPAANSLLGREIARFMAREEGRATLGQILDRARDQVLEPTESDPGRALIQTGIAMMIPRDGEHTPSVARLALEASWMYELLGDPALRVAFPRADLAVRAETGAEGTEVLVGVASALPAGTEIEVSLELPRDEDPARPPRVPNPLDPASFDRIRENHRRMNDWALARTTLRLEADGTAQTTLALPAGRAPRGLVVKAWALADGDVHQGATVLE